MPPLSVQQLIEETGLPGTLGDIVTIIGAGDPILKTPFRVGELAATVLGAQGALFAELYRMRTGRVQRVSIDRRAAAAALQSVLFQTVWGHYPIALTEPRYPTVDMYQTSDQRWIMLNGGYPLLREGLLDLLKCPDNADAIGASVARFQAQDLEDGIAAHKLCGVIVRSEQEWRDHPQGKAIAARPPIEITRIGDAAPEPLPPGDRPLSGVRVLDMTHVIAGPTCGKSLAEQGATVLHLYCPSRPQLPPFDMDTGHGKLSAYLDIAGVEGPLVIDEASVRDRDRERLRALLSSADVFAQSYRPGSLAAKGFSAEDIAALRPGIIVVSFNCYGWGGDAESPWEMRPGFEQLAQCATGMAMHQGTPERPRLCEGFYPNDYITGFLGSIGVLAALIRRAKEGGSWHVRVSLCRSAMLLLEQGLVDPAGAAYPSLGFLDAYMRECDAPIGRLRYLGPVLRMSVTPSAWTLPPAPLGAHPPEWPGN